MSERRPAAEFHKQGLQPGEVKSVYLEVKAAGINVNLLT